MSRIGYAPGAFDLSPIGHLNLLREVRSRCDFLIAGVVADGQRILRTISSRSDSGMTGRMPLCAINTCAGKIGRRTPE
jgi:glycerol-3-phosphate cytidylyltransferase